MSTKPCPHCGKPLDLDSGAAFCPYCGGSLAVPKAENEAVEAVLAQVTALTDPRKKHEVLEKAQKEHPDSLAIAEEILMLGRLYKRNPKVFDFSVIKSYLLMIYLDTDALPDDKIAAMRTELFFHPDLAKCLSLAPDADAFMRHYLTRLSREFIQLFLFGSSKYMHRYFGFGLDSRAPKLLADPAVRMLSAIKTDKSLLPEQRSLLMQAFYAGFAQQLNNTQYLDQAMAAMGLQLN